mmetsp:Transcript_37895/g.90688  ORF Transcript_37895/g.90688 Transcript_37895/m.90688 type:complete len:263 (+) Transcript_37895:165-953(+)
MKALKCDPETPSFLSSRAGSVPMQRRRGAPFPARTPRSSETSTSPPEPRTPPNPHGVRPRPVAPLRVRPRPVASATVPCLPAGLRVEVPRVEAAPLPPPDLVLRQLPSRAEEYLAVLPQEARAGYLEVSREVLLLRPPVLRPAGPGAGMLRPPPRRPGGVTSREAPPHVRPLLLGAEYQEAVGARRLLPGRGRDPCDADDRDRVSLPLEVQGGHGAVVAVPPAAPPGRGAAAAVATGAGHLAEYPPRVVRRRHPRPGEGMLL